MRITRRSLLVSPVVVGMTMAPLGIVHAQEPPVLALEFEPIFERLNRPLDYVDVADGSGRFFIVQQNGEVLISVGGDLLDQPLLDISDSISSGNEQGLLGLALDPGFDDNGRVFVSYTDENGTSQIVRYTTDVNDPNRLDPDSATTILSLEQPYQNHNGGNIVFGPDGLLYIGFGDGGGQGDPNGNGQNPAVLYAKILRIDVSGNEEPYGIPMDNPFVDDPAFAAETFAWGFRNPWRFSFDRQTGDLWIGDVGQNWLEEIDLVPAGTSGQNFGWSIMEGTDCYETDSCDQSGLTLPVDEYTHDYGCSVTGGYVYRGALIPDLVGTYLFADYCSGNLWGLLPNGDGSFTASATIETGYTPSSFAQDASSELYIVDLEGTIARVVSGR